MKKSLLITLDWPPKGGGVGNYLWHLTNNLPEKEVVVLTESTLPPSPPASFLIYQKKLIAKTPFIWPKWLFLFYAVLKIIAKERIKYLLVGQILPIGTVALILKKTLAIPYLVFTYGTDLLTIRDSRRKTRLAKLILANADQIITITDFTKKIAIKLGAPEQQITIVYPCASVVPEKIDEREIISYDRKLNLTGKKIILTVGRLVERKGHDMVIRSLPKIKKEIPNVIYLIAGNGPYLSQLKNLIDQVNVRDSVIILENISDRSLQVLYRLCDVFVMPSRELFNQDKKIIDAEGFGIVFLEANLFGKPVIGGRSGGQTEAIADHFSGLLVNPNDSDAISQAVIFLLKNPEEAERLGRQGAKKALSTFQWAEQAKKITNLLT